MRGMLAILGLLLAAHAACAVAQGGGTWRFSAGFELGATGGWVRVRENHILGTHLRIRNDLHADTLQTLRLGAIRTLSPDSALHFDVSTSRLHGRAVFAAPVEFNGTTTVPGALDTTTHFQDFIALHAAWWRRLLPFDGGRGALWGSVGFDYVMLNFRLHGTIASNSTGHELKEDFYVQELPIPTLGLHLRYPLADAWQLQVDARAGRLPWVNSLRTEGGEVRLAQTDVDVRAGVRRPLSRDWWLKVYAFHHALVQSERSREDGNYVRLHATGLGVRIEHRF